jgi:hypothetical protein
LLTQKICAFYLRRHNSHSNANSPSDLLYKKAERRIIESKPDHEYGPIDGLPKFKEVAAKLAFGADSPIIKNNLVSRTFVVVSLRLVCYIWLRIVGKRSSAVGYRRFAISWRLSQAFRWRPFDLLADTVVGESSEHFH